MKLNKILKVALGCFVVFQISCSRMVVDKSGLNSHVQLNALRAGPYETKEHFVEKRWVNYFLFELLPTAHPNIDSMIQAHLKPGEFVTDLSIRKERSFLNGLVCILTAGFIYCPETLTLEGNVVAQKIEPPKDSDGDGIIDSLDHCSNTVAGTKVDATGCPVVVDSDSDGVPDAEDKCENTTTSTKVDATGCPIVGDLDGDGVKDDQDQCPNTKAGTVVDAFGCPKASKMKGVLNGVEFATNSDRLTNSSEEVLNGVVENLKAFPDSKAEIQGYTDNRGKTRLNTTLSQKRAEAVMKYLIQKGVNRDRLRARGYGSAKPIASNADELGRKQNRRVELKWLDEN